jgi:nucleotide-binding universal stress UspA family protein
MNRGLVVVGVDGSDSSEAALRWALAEARIRQAPMQVVHVFWALPMVAPPDEMLEHDWRAEPVAATEFVRDFVSSTIGEPTDVEIETIAVQGKASERLIEAARSADLLVVGAHGDRRRSERVLGSVSMQCLHHESCPVVIVHSSRSNQTGA